MALTSSDWSVQSSSLDISQPDESEMGGCVSKERRQSLPAELSSQEESAQNAGEEIHVAPEAPLASCDAEEAEGDQSASSTTLYAICGTCDREERLLEAGNLIEQGPLPDKEKRALRELVARLQRGVGLHDLATGRLCAMAETSLTEKSQLTQRYIELDILRSEAKVEYAKVLMLLDEILHFMDERLKSLVSQSILSSDV